MKGKIEEALDQLTPVQPSAEHEVDVLRLVLTGQRGTEAQRNALLRIIKDNLAGKLYAEKLSAKIGAPVFKPGTLSSQFIRTTYNK